MLLGFEDAIRPPGLPKGDRAFLVPRLPPLAQAEVVARVPERSCRGPRPSERARRPCRHSAAQPGQSVARTPEPERIVEAEPYDSRTGIRTRSVRRPPRSRHVQEVNDGRAKIRTWVSGIMSPIWAVAPDCAELHNPAVMGVLDCTGLRLDAAGGGDPVRARYAQDPHGRVDPPRRTERGHLASARQGWQLRIPSLGRIRLPLAPLPAMAMGTT